LNKESEKKMKKYLKIIKGILFPVLLLPGIVLLSCQSAPAGQKWSGVSMENQTEWNLQLLENNQAILKIPFPSLTEIHGEAFESEPDHWVFHTDELHLFFNWHDGWTESTISLQGMLELTRRSKESWQIRVIEMPQTGTVLQAEIRYRRDKIYGDRARDMMSRRLDRAIVLSGFLQTELAPEDYSFHHKKRGIDSKAYHQDLQSLLFPELYGFSDAFPEPEASSSDKEGYIRNEEVLWDTLYTKKYFPEELHEVRDSGTLLRDYDEASELIIICCLWQDLWESWLPHSDIRSTK
jgi:hypothetical protein